MLSYPLHPAGGIRGCDAQEGETGEGQRELSESQRGENSRPSVVICFVFFGLHLCCGVSAMCFQQITCQSVNVGRAVMSLFVDEVLYVVLLSLALQQWWLSLLRIITFDIFFLIVTLGNSICQMSQNKTKA